MIAIELDPAQQNRLNVLAAAQGQDSAALARQVLLDYLDFQALPADSDAAWAEAAITLTPEFMSQDDWGDAAHGS